MKKTDAEYAAMTLPKRGTCLVDRVEHEAVMTLDYFDGLLTYNSSLPTGTFIGKRWKKFEGRDGRVVRPRSWDGDAVRWVMGEYVECDPPDPDRVAIVWYRITHVSP